MSETNNIEPGTVMIVNKALLDYYFQVTDRTEYDAKKDDEGHDIPPPPPTEAELVPPLSLQLLNVEQKIVFVRAISDERGDPFFIFEYDAAVMKFGIFFMKFLQICAEAEVMPGFRIDHKETYKNVYYGLHDEIYQKAVIAAINLKQERKESWDKNADVLAKYLFPTEHVVPKFGFKLWVSYLWFKFQQSIFKLTKGEKHE